MQLSLALLAAVMSATAYVTAVACNEWLFSHAEYAQGIHWIYLPAGIRLLCVLLFGGWGAVGLLAGSWAASFYYFPEPDNVALAIGHGVLSAAVPYLLYCLLLRTGSLRPSLASLTGKRLLACMVLYAVAGPLVRHWWWAGLRGVFDVPGMLVMMAGDLAGSLLVMYALKGMLFLLFRKRAISA